MKNCPVGLNLFIRSYSNILFSENLSTGRFTSVTNYLKFVLGHKRNQSELEPRARKRTKHAEAFLNQLKSKVQQTCTFEQYELIRTKFNNQVQMLRLLSRNSRLGEKFGVAKGHEFPRGPWACPPPPPTPQLPGNCFEMNMQMRCNLVHFKTQFREMLQWFILFSMWSRSDSVAVGSAISCALSYSVLG